jgi:TrmH family RNA methyltransferase
VAGPIRSTTNPRVKALVRLRKRRERDERRRFLIEGEHEVARALAASVALDEVYVCPEFMDERALRLRRRLDAAGIPVVELTEEPFRKAAYREHPDGVLAVARQFGTRLDGVGLPSAPLLLVVEAVEKPGNLGTMLRTADAAGADAVIVCDPATDPFNPNVVRASRGTLFTVPVVVADATGALDWLERHHIAVYAALPDATRSFWDVSYRGAVAAAIGSEHAGLTGVWKERAVPIRIPMTGAADSLNAAMAAGLVLYEAVRQRRA